MEELKKQLFSENGMKIINALFFISFLIPNTYLLIGTFVLWIAFLVYSFKNTKSMVLKIIYGILGIVAAVYVLLNGYFLMIY